MIDRGTLPHHIDSTMISCFRSCPQKFLLEFVHGYRPVGLSVDLHAGACFASALEFVYKSVWIDSMSLPEALLKAQANFFIQWGDFEISKKTTKTPDRVWEAVESYFKIYPPRTEHVQPYFNADGTPTFEYTFAIPLEYPGFPLHPDGSPFLYTGRFDMLGSYNGRPVVRDEKTTGRTITAYWSDQWNLRSQFIGYVWACQQSGIDLDTVIVRGIQILKTTINHAEAIKIYNQEIVGRWFEQLRRDLNRIRSAWDEGYFDYNFANSCNSYGNCVFMPVCQSATPESWLTNFEVRHWNPLVKNPVEAPAEAA